MPIKKLCILYFSLVLLGGTVWAQSQSELNQQAHPDFVKADKELNLIYKKLMKTVSGPEKERWVSAQLKWVEFRDLDAKACSAQMLGGSAEVMLFHGRRAANTRQRTQDIQRYLESFESR